MLKPANIVVDVDHVLPPDIEALLPKGLRDLLDCLRIAPLTSTYMHTEVTAGYNGTTTGKRASFNY